MKFSQFHPRLKGTIIIVAIGYLLMFSVSVYLCFKWHNESNSYLVFSLPLAATWFVVSMYLHIKAHIIKYYGPFGEIIEAWHFAQPDRCLTNGDGREIIEGETLTIEGNPKICKHGLHASKNILDALRNAPGPIICRVEVGGKIVEDEDEDKLVGKSRKCLWWIDGDKLLHEFACKCAERILKKQNIKTPELWNGIDVKRKWLAGKATDDELEAASTDARWTANSATTSVAYFAAESDARLAARWAANSACMSVAGEGVWLSAESVGDLTERKWQEETLLRMIEEERKL